MTTTTPAIGPTANGPPPRKQLSDQLDRMDTIIDALAEGLPGAVADACREGARQAVKDAVLEILTNPDLRALVGGAAPPAPPPVMAAPTVPPAAGAGARLKEKAKVAAAAAAARVRAAADQLRAASRTLSAVLPVRRVLLVGAGVGVVVGAIGYAGPHELAAALGGAGGACAAVAAQVGRWCWRSARLLGLGAN